MNLQAIKQRFGIIGRSEALDHALGTAVRVAPSDLTVLVNGESGVGKEAFSKIIHSLSPRKHNNFIAVNCGAIPAGTINSELFGHEKGAFTGANSDRKGYFETVDGGTIFLDEVGEMPLDTQAYLLRILETGEFLRVGSSKVQTTDVRVIAATNVNLTERIQNGKFREDLYYRLNTVPIKVPALRERKEDIYMLFRYFSLDFAERNRFDPIQLNEAARRLLENYAWPGNIRELKNVAEQISILSEERLVTEQELIAFLPNIGKRNLPMMTNPTSGQFQERDILFNFLFEMRKDLSDLKGLVYGLINQNDLDIPENTDPNVLPAYLNAPGANDLFHAGNNRDTSPYQPAATPTNGSQPIILDADFPQNDYEAEVVEESLSLEDMEKELIGKALKKHSGRRKEAALDLGISERTLYRKIKHYELD